MGVQENILSYMLVHGKENKYRLARALKIDVSEVTEALDVLEKEGKIEIKEGKAMLAKGKKPIIAKAGKQEIQPTKEEKPKEEAIEAEKKLEEQPKEEVSEEAPTHEEVRETFGVKSGERLEGTVKFFNPNKGFGFITGDDGKEYYVNESGIKEGVAIDSDDRVSFKVVQDPKGPKAEEVENLTQDGEDGEQFRRTDQEHDQNVA